MNDRCRDCSRCTERGLLSATRALGKVALVIGTLGIWAVIERVANGIRRMCPVCGHPLAWHRVVDGRYQD